MKSNLEKYKIELTKLIEKGGQLQNAMQYECHKDQFEKLAKAKLGDGYSKFLKDIPDFHKEYQRWYSEAHAVIKQLIPDRIGDFVKLYENKSHYFQFRK